MRNIVNTFTGEIYDLRDKTPKDLLESWRILTETIKACERGKEKLRPKVEAILDEYDRYDFGDYRFVRTFNQRKNYDKAVMRQVLDEDTLDLFLVPDKPRLDAWCKELVQDENEQAYQIVTKLRNSLVAVGEPYTAIRLEKVK